MYNASKIKEIIRIISEANLRVPAEMLAQPEDVLVRICNGVGADWMPEPVRKIITRAYASVEASAAIHDWHYAHSDASENSRRIADALFRANALAEIDYKFKWWNWRRYLEQRKLLAAYDALRVFGRVAWLEGYCADKEEAAR